MSSIQFDSISRCITVNLRCTAFSIFNFTSHVYNFVNKYKQSDIWTEPLVLPAQRKHTSWMYQTLTWFNVSPAAYHGIENRWFTHSVSSPGRAYRVVHKSQMSAFEVVGAFFIICALTSRLPSPLYAPTTKHVCDKWRQKSFSTL